MRLPRGFIRGPLPLYTPPDQGVENPKEQSDSYRVTTPVFRPFMDDTTPANETNEPGLNKIDLSQLQDFNFGTQWTEVKPVSPGGRRDFDHGDRRERRDDGGGRGPVQRDRRTFHKPAGPGTS